LFRAIAYLLYRNEEEFRKVREIVVNFISNHWEEVVAILGLDVQYTDEEKSQYTNDYLVHVGEDGVFFILFYFCCVQVWGTENDIIIIGMSLHKDIIVVSDSDFQIQDLINSNLLSEEEAPLFITHESETHFNAVYRMKEVIIEKKSKKFDVKYISNTREKRQITESVKLLESIQWDDALYNDERRKVKHNREKDEEEWEENKMARLEEMKEDI
jgi:hypothetical protein